VEQNIIEEIMQLEPSTLVTLYEINLDKKIPGGRYYFHAGENGYGNTIVFEGNNYYFHPISVEGFDYVEQTLPRPTLTADNSDSFFSLKTRFFEDFIDYEFVRKRTFVRFLSADNFPNNINPYGAGTEDSFPDETYVINKKITENAKVIQFELTSPLEKEGGEIPSRKVVFNTCQWRYRHPEGCGYNGVPICDAQNNNFTEILPANTALVNRGTYNDEQTYSIGDYVNIVPDNIANDPAQFFVCLRNNTQDIMPGSDKNVWLEDVCSKSIFGCRLRFGALEPNNGLPFGGFPGSFPQ
jgi:lambda family phage minor tail protein L